MLRTTTPPAEDAQTSLEAALASINNRHLAEATRRLWRRARDEARTSHMVSHAIFTQALLYTARFIFEKLANQLPHPSTEIHQSYLHFLHDSLMSYGTANTASILSTWERIFQCVQKHLSQPLPLMEEYQHCIDAQEAQRSAEEEHPRLTTDEPPPLEPLIDNPNPFVIVVPQLCSYVELQHVLQELPPRMTFAHSRGIMRLQLTNPLPLPECSCVLGGYSCDTCHTAHLRLAYQAILFEEEEEEKEKEKEEVLVTGVRNNTLRIGNNRGFDMCVACAVFFVDRQRTSLRACLRAPFTPFHLGATRVRVHESQADVARRCVRITASVAPWSARLVTWVVDETLANTSDCDARIASEELLPPRDWSTAATLEQNVAPSDDVDEPQCMICLAPLYGCGLEAKPTVRTRCDHHFHADCMELYGGMTSACPLCRREDALPPSTLEAVLEHNRRTILLHLTPEQSQRHPLQICIGSLLSHPQYAEDVTSIGAAECVFLR